MKKVVRSITFPIGAPICGSNRSSSNRSSSNRSSSNSCEKEEEQEEEEDDDRWQRHHQKRCKTNEASAAAAGTADRGVCRTHLAAGSKGIEEAAEAAAAEAVTAAATTITPTTTALGVAPLSSSPRPITIHLQECLDGAFGLFLWSAAKKLASFLFRLWQQEPLMFKGKRVIELGAGYVH